ELGQGLHFNDAEPGTRRKVELWDRHIEDGKELRQFAFASDDIEQRLRVIEKWMAENEGKMNPIEYATRLYQRLVSVHAVPDGNGRTNRLILDWVLRRSGLPPAIFTDPEKIKAMIFPEDPRGRNTPPEEVLRAVTGAVENTLD